MAKLQLSYPINGNPIVLTQRFANVDPMYTNMGMRGHNGLDYRTYHGQPVYASHDGYASYQVDSGGGHGVVIISDKEYEVNGETSHIKSIYWHLVDPLKEPKFKSPIADKTGFVKVESGDLIGYADNTGMSTGTHLHFGLKTVAKGEDQWVWYNTNQNNGYFGCIDPQPFFNGSTQVQIENLKKQVTLLTAIVELLKKLLSAK